MCQRSCLQQEGELGVPVGDMATASVLYELGDNPAERCQGLVDAARLLQLVAHRLRALVALTPCRQTHQII